MQEFVNSYLTKAAEAGIPTPTAYAMLKLAMLRQALDDNPVFAASFDAAMQKRAQVPQAGQPGYSGAAPQIPVESMVPGYHPNKTPQQGQPWQAAYDPMLGMDPANPPTGFTGSQARVGGFAGGPQHDFVMSKLKARQRPGIQRVRPESIFGGKRWGLTNWLDDVLTPKSREMYSATPEYQELAREYTEKRRADKGRPFHELDKWRRMNAEPGAASTSAVPRHLQPNAVRQARGTLDQYEGVRGQRDMKGRQQLLDAGIKPEDLPPQYMTNEEMRAFRGSGKGQGTGNPNGTPDLTDPLAVRQWLASSPDRKTLEFRQARIRASGDYQYAQDQRAEAQALAARRAAAAEARRTRVPEYTTEQLLAFDQAKYDRYKDIQRRRRRAAAAESIGGYQRPGRPDTSGMRSGPNLPGY